MYNKTGQLETLVSILSAIHVEILQSSMLWVGIRTRNLGTIARVYLTERFACKSENITDTKENNQPTVQRNVDQTGRK